MITEDYVSFEVAKLLKEKGFDWPCHATYDTAVTGGKPKFSEYEVLNFFPYGMKNTDDKYGMVISAPTLQMTMKWLKEVHNVLIVIDYEWECDTTPYYFKIYRLGENGKPERVPVKGISYDKDDIPTEHIVGYRDWERSNDDFKSYEQACEAAIKYCLENLV